MSSLVSSCRHRQVMFIDNVRKTIRNHGMLSPRDRVVVAVSGGPDSVCLLSVLKELTPEFDLALHVAHLDHRFRGEESASEARFVKELARKFGIPATVEAADVPTYCRERGLAPPAGAREVRYAFLSRVAREVNASRIATGHTASDQAETFLLRMLRGAGMSGLSSIPPVRENIVRPLIDVTREEVDEHLRQLGLPSASDPSNAKPVYTRNRIRLELLPALKRFNPRIVETIAAEAALLRDDEAVLRASVEREALTVTERCDGGVALMRDRFNALPLALRRRLLRWSAGLAGAPASALSRVQIEEALRFIETAQTGRSLRMPFGTIVERKYDRFLVRRSSERFSFSLDIPVPGRAAVPELALEIEASLVETDDSRDAAKTPSGKEAANYLWQAQFDYDKITAPLSLRNRRPGDRIRPAGMAGRSKKLQDLFTDRKLSQDERDRVPVLVSGDDILWVLGIRMDGRFLPGPKTKRLLLVNVRSTC
jgi:tRNA(Ile)-lysidine synthase